MLQAGDRIPDFELSSHEGEAVSSGALAGSWVVLHTFPLAFTGG